MVNRFSKKNWFLKKSLFYVQSTVDGCHQHFQKKQKHLLKRFCLKRNFDFCRTNSLFSSKHALKSQIKNTKQKMIYSIHESIGYQNPIKALLCREIDNNEH